MASFSFSPKSPKIDTPVCDSDEEVFFGPVTSKELQKASQLKRRTQFYFPAFEWNPSTSSFAKTNVTSSAVKALETSEQPNLSLSADSLESQSFVTLSDKPEDSSKGEFWSALSGNSLSSNSQTSLNNAKFYSKVSEESLEAEQLLEHDNKLERNLGQGSHEPSEYSNISEDSLENTKQQMNFLTSRWAEEPFNNSEHLSKEPMDYPDASAEGYNRFTPNVTQTGSENGLNESLLSTPRVGPNGMILRRETAPSKSGDLLTNTFEIFPKVDNNETYLVDDKISAEVGKNDTYSVDNESCQIVDLVEPANPNINLPDEVTVDKDGGFLSILSEAALYHASQLKENDHALSQQQEEYSSMTQSLEERFKTFGIDSAELEDQQLISSIMYMTGRESNVLCSEMESNTFYTGRSSIAASYVKGCSEESCLKSVDNTADSNSGSLVHCELLSTSCGENLAKSGSASSVHYEQVYFDCGKMGEINVTSESQDSASSGMQHSNVLNLPIANGTLGSAGSTFQHSADDEASYHLDNKSGHDILDRSGSSVGESSEISGVCALNSVSGNQSTDCIQCVNDEEPSNNDSAASSYGGEMNDTLEEYEMMMRYGVDYILGRKGDQRKAHHSEPTEESVKNLRTDLSPNCSGKSPLLNTAKDISSEYYSVTSPLPYHEHSSSVEYLDAVNVSPSCQQAVNVRGKDSPMQKQLFKRTPQKVAKDVQGITHKGSSLKPPSKLPRVASLTPSKQIHTPSKQIHTPSPQSSKQFTRPITPSSETKFSYKFHSKPVTPSSESKPVLFKKPITPAASVSRTPKTTVPLHHGPKLSNKILDKIQSPVGAYIHNSPSPVLVTNVKAKSTERPSYEKEMHARALWRAGEVKSLIPKPGTAQVANAENINPNIGCGLPSVKYTKAPCINLDEGAKQTILRGGEKITKLMDSPSPQVIKHEGRLRVKCGSPQLAAKMQSMADTFDDSLIDVHSISGDISVCVTQQACRTDTLGHH